MPSKRGYRAMGAALMQTGKEIHLGRAEKLEQQKVDNLNNIAQQRTDLMGEQIDVMRSGQDQRAKHQAQAAQWQQDNKVTADQRQTTLEEFNQGTIEWRQGELTRQRAGAEAGVEHQQKMQEYARVSNEIQRRTAEKGVDSAASKAQQESNKTYMDAIGGVVAQHLDIENLEQARLYSAAVTAMYSDPNFTVMAADDPKGTKARMDNLKALLQANLGDDATKIDATKLESVYSALRAKSRAMGADITESEMIALVNPHIKPPETQAAIPPQFSSTKPFSKTNKDFSAEGLDFANDPDKLANVMMEMLSDPEEFTPMREDPPMFPWGDRYEKGSMATQVDIFSSELVGGAEGTSESFNSAISSIQANWDSFTLRYPTFAGKTFEEVAPLIYEMMNLSPPPAQAAPAPVNTTAPANPQASLMGPQTPQTPGAGLMGGFSSGNDYSGAE